MDRLLTNQTKGVMKLVKLLTNTLTGMPTSIIWKAENGSFHLPGGEFDSLLGCDGKTYISTPDGNTWECFFFQEEVGFHQDIQFECRFHRQEPSAISVDLGELDGGIVNPWHAFMHVWMQTSSTNGDTLDNVNEKFETINYLNQPRKLSWQKRIA